VDQPTEAPVAPGSQEPDIESLMVLIVPKTALAPQQLYGDHRRD
jgi:hypothetical protein